MGETSLFVFIPCLLIHALKPSGLDGLDIPFEGFLFWGSYQLRDFDFFSFKLIYDPCVQRIFRLFP